ncbi:unnamed protein product, partial [Acanthoscelides obtectus]
SRRSVRTKHVYTSKNSGLFRSAVKQTKLSQFEFCKMESLSEVTSDPFLSSIRKLPPRQAKSLHKEALQLLKQPELTRQETRNDSDLDTSGSTSESESNDSKIEDAYKIFVTGSK